MTRPTFDHADVQQLEQIANLIQRKTSYGAIPSQLIVGGHTVPLGAVSLDQTASGCLGDQDLRALYSPTMGNIQLFCHGVTLPETSLATEHVVCVLGHEALHAIQYPCFSKVQIEEATRLNNEASTSSEAYKAYISCDVEFPAHAVMIALELRYARPVDFAQAARKTASHAYFSSRLSEATDPSGTLDQLIEAAAAMHPGLLA